MSDNLVVDRISRASVMSAGWLSGRRQCQL